MMHCVRGTFFGTVLYCIIYSIPRSQPMYDAYTIKNLCSRKKHVCPALIFIHAGLIVFRSLQRLAMCPLSKKREIIGQRCRFGV